MGSVRFATSASVAALAISAVALASPPTVNITINVDGNPYNYAPVGTVSGFPGVYNYAGAELAQSDWLATWNFNATDSTMVSLVYISGSFTFQNLGLLASFFDVFVELDTTPSILPSSLIGGSVGAGLTADHDGGSLTANDLWTAQIDGVNQASLLSGLNLNAVPFGSASASAAFGQPIPNMPGPALGNKMGIRFQFFLTPGDQASFTSVFVVKPVPAPAGLAVLALAGLAGRRRRA